MAYVKRKPAPITLDKLMVTPAFKAHDLDGGWSAEKDDQTPGNGAAAKEDPVSPWLIVGVYLLVAIAAWIGNLIAVKWVKPTPMELKSIEGVTLFAVLYIFAAAIERFVEPVKCLVIGKKKKDAENAVEKARATGTEKEEAEEKAKLNETRQDTKLITWAFATVFAILGTSSTGLFLMHAIGAEKVAPWLDILITGLAIGAGTKPLHDLIGYIENKQEESEDEE